MCSKVHHMTVFFFFFNSPRSVVYLWELAGRRMQPVVVSLPLCIFWPAILSKHQLLPCCRCRWICTESNDGLWLSSSYCPPCLLICVDHCISRKSRGLWGWKASLLSDIHTFVMNGTSRWWTACSYTLWTLLKGVPRCDSCHVFHDCYQKRVNIFLYDQDSPGWCTKKYKQIQFVEDLYYLYHIADVNI